MIAWLNGRVWDKEVKGQESKDAEEREVRRQGFWTLVLGLNGKVECTGTLPLALLDRMREEKQLREGETERIRVRCHPSPFLRLIESRHE